MSRFTRMLPMFSDEDRKKLIKLRDATLKVKLAANDASGRKNIELKKEQDKRRQEFIDFFQGLVNKLISERKSDNQLVSRFTRMLPMFSDEDRKKLIELRNATLECEARPQRSERP